MNRTKTYRQLETARLRAAGVDRQVIRRFQYQFDSDLESLRRSHWDRASLHAFVSTGLRNWVRGDNLTAEEWERWNAAVAEYTRAHPPRKSRRSAP